MNDQVAQKLAALLTDAQREAEQGALSCQRMLEVLRERQAKMGSR